MTDWVNTALPIATLILGSALTMAGQALSDRRTANRELRAHREAFRASNFEMHRTAMLQMQEAVRDCYQAFLDEKQRREEESFYKYFAQDPFRKLEEYSNSVQALLDNADELQQAARTATSELQRQELIREAIKNIGACTKMAEREAAKVTESGSVIATLFPFWEQYVEFIHKLRLSMYRSGSNAVVRRGEAFIDAIYTWNDCYHSTNMDNLVEQVRSSHYELDRALANALAFGPYDTYDSHSR